MAAIAKATHVLNLDFAKNVLKKKPEVVVTESYMDASSNATASV